MTAFGQAVHTYDSSVASSLKSARVAASTSSGSSFMLADFEEEALEEEELDEAAVL